MPLSQQTKSSENFDSNGTFVSNRNIFGNFIYTDINYGIGFNCHHISCKKEIDKSENEIINLKKLYDESKFFTCRETTQNNVEIHQKTEDEPFSLQ